jgi:hypothetical protein
MVSVTVAPLARVPRFTEPVQDIQLLPSKYTGSETTAASMISSTTTLVATLGPRLVTVIKYSIGPSITTGETSSSLTMVRSADCPTVVITLELLLSVIGSK